MAYPTRRLNTLEQLKDGVYASHPLQWAMQGPGGDATFKVRAFDKRGNQLPFYTGSAASPTLTRSDGSTEDGVLLVDMTIRGNTDFNSLVYHILTFPASLNDWPCPDTSVPGLPEGAVAIEITLVSPDSAGHGLMFTPIGWDLDRDPPIPPVNGTDYTPLTESEWYLAYGISESLPTGLALRADGTEVYRLDAAGDSIRIGWGMEPAKSLPSEIDEIASFSVTAGALNAQDKSVDARAYVNGGRLLVTCTPSAGAGSLLVELFPTSADGTVYADTSPGYSVTMSPSTTAVKRFSLEVPNGKWIARFTATTSDFSLVSAKLVPNRM